MTPFFRKIRKTLADDNKPLKYMRYAIGEIVLVVIGILIALQINNWNEKRNNAIQELQLLKSCKIGLLKDLSDIDQNIKTHNRSIASVELILKIIEDNQPYNDTLSKHFGNVLASTKFFYSTSSFETIKSKGVDLITNITLRNQIIDVYDSNYTFFLKIDNRQSDEIRRGSTDIFSTRFEESDKYKILDTENIQGYIVPLDFESLKKDQEFLYYLKSLKNKTILFVNFSYSNLRREVVNLINALQNEINLMENIK
jgi:hypothetical protein